MKKRLRFNTVGKAYKYLEKKPGYWFTTKEIAEEIVKIYPDEVNLKDLKREESVRRGRPIIDQIRLEINMNVLEEKYPNTIRIDRTQYPSRIMYLGTPQQNRKISFGFENKIIDTIKKYPSREFTWSELTEKLMEDYLNECADFEEMKRTMENSDFNVETYIRANLSSWKDFLIEKYKGKVFANKSNPSTGIYYEDTTDKTTTDSVEQTKNSVKTGTFTWKEVNGGFIFECRFDK